MGRYLFTAHYSSGSWARMVKGLDDRTAAARSLIESLGGSVDQMYWTADDGAAHTIAELPDVVSARTVVNTAAKTGAFTSVKVQELLTQDQLSDTLMLTRSAQQFYEAPGKAAVETGQASEQLAGRPYAGGR
jgi:uncharacterized protein with GYD domain